MLFSSKKEKTLLSVCDGEVIPTENIPDDVFSCGILGRGYGIKPKNGKIVSPVDGIVEVVTDTSHAYTVKNSDGLQILIHIGVDTVSLEGKGFNPCVREGQKIKAGDTLCIFDIEKIKQRGIPTETAVLVTNDDEIEIVKCKYGTAEAGVTPVLQYRMK